MVDWKMEYAGYLAGHEPRIMHEEILHELARARAKFPTQDIWKTLAALTEEVGELNEAILQLYSDTNPKGKTRADIRKQAVQVATMAMRVVLDT
jgi:NTP pyrophosphatase (non-canonical NTP hydrolase)